MLNNLKQEIKRQEMDQFMLESMTTGGDGQIKDAFLDNVSFAILGAENDPEIKGLAATIPEYDDTDGELEAEIQTMTENLIETQI